MKMLTKYDIAIIIAVLIMALCSYTVLGLAVFGGKPDAVEITVDGKLYGKYKLNPQVINIETEFGNNVLEIYHDGAQMTDSDCKDRLDVKCGKISKAGQIIICIPNRVTVKLTGNSGENVDKVTY